MNSPLLTLASVTFSGSLLLAVREKDESRIVTGEAHNISIHNTGQDGRGKKNNDEIDGGVK